MNLASLLPNTMHPSESFDLIQSQPVNFRTWESSQFLNLPNLHPHQTSPQCQSLLLPFSKWHASLLTDGCNIRTTNLLWSADIIFQVNLLKQKHLKAAAMPLRILRCNLLVWIKSPLPQQIIDLNWFPISRHLLHSGCLLDSVHSIHTHPEVSCMPPISSSLRFIFEVIVWKINRFCRRSGRGNSIFPGVILYVFQMPAKILTGPKNTWVKS